MKESIHKITDREELRLLLQLFMDGATSLEQEAALADYFRTNEVDDEFADYRDMFLVFESGELAPTFELPAPEPIAEEEPHEAAPLPTGQKPHSRIVPLIVRYTAIAASLAAAFFIGMRFSATDVTPTTVDPSTLMATATPEVKTIVKTDTVYVEKHIVHTVRETTPIAPSAPQQGDLAQATPNIFYGITDEQLLDMQQDIEQEFERMTREMDLFEQELMN